MISAILCAAGSGSRAGFSGNKVLRELNGLPVLLYSVSAFAATADEILIACREEDRTRIDALLSPFPNARTVLGGGTRTQSVYSALQAAQGDIVLVHDGVRPLVSGKLISDCIESVKKYGSGIAVAPAIETIVNLDKEDNISGITDRSKCFYAKAPQGFVLKDLYGVHIEARKKGSVNAIDSASLMHEYGYTLHTVPCSYENIKITTPADFYIFRALYDARENSQVFGL